MNTNMVSPLLRIAWLSLLSLRCFRDYDIIATHGFSNFASELWESGFVAMPEVDPMTPGSGRSSQSSSRFVRKETRRRSGLERTIAVLEGCRWVKGGKRHNNNRQVEQQNCHGGEVREP